MLKVNAKSLREFQRQRLQALKRYNGNYNVIEKNIETYRYMWRNEFQNINNLQKNIYRLTIKVG